MKFTPTKKRWGGGCLSHTGGGGGHKKLSVALTGELQVLAIIKGVTKSIPLQKGGGGVNSFTLS